MRAGSATSAQRFLERRQPSLEAQVANLADEIAYNNHDVDDGIRAGLITIDELREVAIFRRQYELVTARYPGLGSRRLVHEVVRRMIDYLVNDLIAASEARRSPAPRPADVEAVRARPEPLLTFSEEVRAEHLELKQYLRRHLYRHYKVLRMTTKAGRVVSELFQAMFGDDRADADRASGSRARMEAEAGRPGPGARGGRLHRRHDRPLRDPRAPAAVRSVGADVEERIDDSDSG